MNLRRQMEILLAVTLAAPLLSAFLYGRLQGRNRWLVTGCAGSALLCNALRHELLSPGHWTAFYVTYVSFWTLYFAWAKWLRQRYWVLTVVFVLPGMCLFLMGRDEPSSQIFPLVRVGSQRA